MRPEPQRVDLGQGNLAATAPRPRSPGGTARPVDPDDVEVALLLVLDGTGVLDGPEARGLHEAGDRLLRRRAGPCAPPRCGRLRRRALHHQREPPRRGGECPGPRRRQDPAPRPSVTSRFKSSAARACMRADTENSSNKKFSHCESPSQLAVHGFPSPPCRRHVFDMTWGGARGGGNPDIRGLGIPPHPCPSPTKGEGTLREPCAEMRVERALRGVLSRASWRAFFCNRSMGRV